VSPPSSLNWLHSDLDRCRDLIAHERVQASEKSTAREPHETVTNIDLGVQQFLTEAVLDRYPGAAILAEEADSQQPGALEEPVCFVIDPIDGTDELVAGRPGYAISIALFVQGAPVAAMVDMPAFKRRFECGLEQPTTLNGKTVRLGDSPAEGDARLAVSATQYRMEKLQAYWSGLQVRGLIPTPAFAAKFCSVMAGDSDGAVYLPVRPLRTAIWDYAGVAILLRHAGGQFLSTDGVDLLERRPLGYRGGWIAAPPQLGRRLLALAQLVPEGLVEAASVEDQ
jgi:fructose-1,6-bisphosphatase/inositol monophosphatase family enzyme